MKIVRSFVIRVYRRDAVALAGLVEDVQSRRSAAFRSVGELGELLWGRRPFPRRPRRGADGDALSPPPGDE